MNYLDIFKRNFRVDTECIYTEKYVPICIYVTYMHICPYIYIYSFFFFFLLYFSETSNTFEPPSVIVPYTKHSELDSSSLDSLAL